VSKDGATEKRCVYQRWFTYHRSTTVRARFVDGSCTTRPRMAIVPAVVLHPASRVAAV
jgi:hypothetical protein